MTYFIKNFSFRRALSAILVTALKFLEQEHQQEAISVHEQTTAVAAEGVVHAQQAIFSTHTQTVAIGSDGNTLQTRHLPQAEAYIPHNFRLPPDTYAKDQARVQYIEQSRLNASDILSTEAIKELMAIADRFSCTTEMATFLAIMLVGGPQQLCYWNSDWDAFTRQAVYRIHVTLAQGCVDNLEFALKIYAAWSQGQYEGKSFISSSALLQRWYERRIPTFPQAMREKLGRQAIAFLQELLHITNSAAISKLVERYHIQEESINWLHETEVAFHLVQQEAWANTFFMQHDLLQEKVEPERERLLKDFELNKKDEERRPLNFDLLEKVRIIFAYTLLAQPVLLTPLAQHVHIETQWLQWLQQEPHSIMALARFIAQKTRSQTYDGELIPTFAAHRLFLDQCYPLKSRYSCRVIAVATDGTLQVQLLQKVADAPAIQEGFRETSLVTNSPYIPILRATAKHSGDRSLLPYNEQFHQDNKITLGQLAAHNVHHAPGEIFEAEVVGYTFEQPTRPKIIVTPLQGQTTFDVFCTHYQIGDLLEEVEVRGFDERPGDPYVALLVREPTSQLEILLEAEQISFLELGQAIKMIPLGTKLKVLVDDINVEQHVVKLTMLPLIELHLNKQLHELLQVEEGYETEATIYDIGPNVLHILLPWSEPARGLIYIVTSIQAIPEQGEHEQIRYSVGDRVLLHLAFPTSSLSKPLPALPLLVRQAIAQQNDVKSLQWDQQNHLHFLGRMQYNIYAQFLALSNEASYQQALRDLYRASHHFMIKSITPLRKEIIANEQVETSTIEMQDNASQVRQLVAKDDSLEDLKQDLLHHYLTDSISEVIAQEQLTNNTTLLQYKIKDRLRVHVTGVKEFGAFVETEAGVRGLIPKREMWGYVVDARDSVQPETIVEVIVLRVNTEENTLDLSMRIPENNPIVRYQPNTLVDGVVSDIRDFGAVVTIEPDVSGIIYKREMWGYVTDVHNAMHVGDRVTAQILEVIPEKDWLILSEKVPDYDPLYNYRPGDIVTGVITDIKDYGVFVEIERGVSGLIYKNDIHDGLTDARKSNLHIDDEVTVLIVRINMERRHLSLSLKDAK